MSNIAWLFSSSSLSPGFIQGKLKIYVCSTVEKPVVATQRWLGGWLVTAAFPPALLCSCSPFTLPSPCSLQLWLIMFHNSYCACHWRGGKIQTTDRTWRVLRQGTKTFFLPKCQRALANTSGKSVSKCVLAVLLIVEWGRSFWSVPWPSWDCLHPHTALHHCLWEYQQLICP